MPRAAFVVCLLVVFILGAGLVALNSTSLQIELLIARPQLTVGQWLVVVFIAGWFAGIATVWHYVRKLRRARRDLRRQVRLAESELKVLRPHLGAGASPLD